MRMRPLKRTRSLKVAVPPPAELARAWDQIIKRLASFDLARDKIRIVPADAEARRKNAIVNDITKRLRAHKLPRQSKVMVRNQVLMACATAETAKYSTKPATEEGITRELVGAARKMYRVLGNPDLPPIHLFNVFHDVESRNQFVEHLERFTKLTYNKPPRNTDQLKRDCATVAYLLIAKYTCEKPTSTRGGLLRTVAGLLHQYASPTADEEIIDLKSACDVVCNRAKAGINLETARWY
jgi:hypothetical protein